MNKIKIDNYYKPESKTLRLDEVDYTIIPSSNIKSLDKLQQENKQLKDNWNKLIEWIDSEIKNEKHTTHWEVKRKKQELESGNSDESN